MWRRRPFRSGDVSKHPLPSKPGAEKLPPHAPLTAADHKGIPLLAALDDQLVSTLQSGAIKLIRADFLRAIDSEEVLPNILRRQELERIEKARGVQIFLTPDEAVAALRSLTRSVAGLTYGWTSPDHPDISRQYLSNIRRYLRDPLGEHVVALFWDFPSLPQKPRTAAEDELFNEALKVMGDVYASPLGTTVVRHRSVPAQPAELDGELHSVLGAFDNPRFEEGRWRIRFPTHAAAVEAVEAARAADALPDAVTVFLFYNGRPYPARGWTTFESAVSTEAIARLAYFSGLGKLIGERLPPKVIEIDGERPRVAEADDRADEGMGPRNKRVIAAIQEATFTGKGDKPVVAGLYRDYAIKVNIAMTDSGDLVKGEYMGDLSVAGERDGRGVLRSADGDVYEGDFKAGKFDGCGVYRSANGDVYEGEFKADKKEGRGIYRYADGHVYDGEWKAGKFDGCGVYRSANGDVYDGEWKADKKEGRGVYREAKGPVWACFYEQDLPVGEGVRWSTDGLRASRLREGQLVEKISLEEAQRTVERLAIPIPSLCSYA